MNEDDSCSLVAFKNAFSNYSCDVLLCLQRAVVLIRRSGRRGHLHTRLLQPLEGADTKLASFQDAIRGATALFQTKDHFCEVTDGPASAQMLQLLSEFDALDAYRGIDGAQMVEDRNDQMTSINSFSDTVEAVDSFYQTAHSFVRDLRAMQSDVSTIFGGLSHEAMDTALDAVTPLVEAVGLATHALLELHNITQPFT
jgi:hypothetical protein